MITGAALRQLEKGPARHILLVILDYIACCDLALCFPSPGVPKNYCLEPRWEQAHWPPRGRCSRKTPLVSAFWPPFLPLGRALSKQRLALVQNAPGGFPSPPPSLPSPPQTANASASGTAPARVALRGIAPRRLALAGRGHGERFVRVFCSESSVWALSSWGRVVVWEDVVEQGAWSAGGRVVAVSGAAASEGKHGEPVFVEHLAVGRTCCVVKH